MDAEVDKRDFGRRRRDRVVATMQDRSILILGSVTLIGITLVAWGWVIQGKAYIPSLLMELGTSMMLLVPLALLGFVIENRMRQAEAEIRATAKQLDSLTAITRQRLAEHQRQRDDLLDAAQRDPTQGMMLLLLNEAAEMGAVVPSGVRVAMPGSSLRLRFRPAATDIVAQIEEADGRMLGLVPWRSAETAAVFAKHLAGSLRDLGRYPGDSTFDPSAVIQQLLKTVRIGIEGRSGKREQDLGPLIELPNDQWAISSDGLFSLQRLYRISAQRVVGSHEDWPGYMRTQAWVDVPAFEEAYALARQLLRPDAGTPPSAQEPEAKRDKIC